MLRKEVIDATQHRNQRCDIAGETFSDRSSLGVVLLWLQPVRCGVELETCVVVDALDRSIKRSSLVDVY